MTEKILSAVELAARIQRLQRRARWLGWRLVECPGPTWAAVNLRREDIRYPDSGGMDLGALEQFLDVREADPVF